MPIKHYTDSEYLGSEFSDSGKKYPNPFVDLAKNYIPKNIKKICKIRPLITNARNV